MAQITVTIGADGKLTAVNNPTQEDRGKDVIWVFGTGTTGRNLIIEFRLFFPPGSTTPSPNNPNPFVSLGPLGSNQFGGRIRQLARDGLYLYDIFDENTRLEWAVSLAQGGFGGLEIPKPPPPPPPLE